MKSDLFEKLQLAVQGQPETPPKGYKTVKQWAKDWGMSACNARRYIDAGLDNKIMKEREFRVRVGKLIRNTPHYAEVRG